MTTTNLENSPKKLKWPIILGVLVAIILLVIILANNLNTVSPPPETEKPTQLPTPPTKTAVATDEAQQAVAVVNGNPILKKIFDEQVELRKKALAEMPNAPEELPELELKLEVLENMINLAIIIAEAKTLDYAPSETELNAAMEQITANYPGDIEELEKILQAHGATLDDFRSQIADNLTLKNYRDIAFLVEARIPEEQAIAFYEQNLERLTHDDQVRALQIMIPLPFATSADDAEVAAQKKAQARAKAEMALKEAQEGLDFNELIDRYMDPTTKMATNDGQLFWVTRGSSGFPEMEEVLFSLEPGEVGGLIESEFSFHIVKVLEKKPAGVTPYEQVRWEIMEFLTDNSINIALDKRLKQLRSEAQIEIIDPELKAAWADFQAKIYAPPAPADLNENSDEFQDSSDHESEIVSESEAASASEAVSESEVVEEQSAGSDTPSQETVGEPAP